MRCPNCSHDQKKKYGFTCSSCGYRFVFHPATGMTDGRFAAIVKNTSADDTYWYTENQLYMQWVRRLSAGLRAAHAMIGLGAWLMLCAGLFELTTPIQDSMGELLAAGAVALFLGALAYWRPRIPKFETFQSQLSRWVRSNGRGKLIAGGQLGVPPPDTEEADLYDYGVEALLIVQHERLVDFLVSNGFHAEHRTLVISATGYPQYLVPVAKRLSEEAPELHVFLLHDTHHSMASAPADLGLASKSENVFDLGLHLDDAVNIKRLSPVDPRSLPGPIPVDLLHPKALLGALAVAMKNHTKLGVPLGAYKGDPGDDTSEFVGYGYGSTFG